MIVGKTVYPGFVISSARGKCQIYMVTAQPYGLMSGFVCSTFRYRFDKVPTKNTIAPLLARGKDWFRSRGWEAFPFQVEAWEAYLQKQHGLLNAPTGSGKTYAMLMPVVLDFIGQYPEDYDKRSRNGLQLIWISPIRALTQEIKMSAERLISDFGLQWEVGIRTGDTSSKERAAQRRRLPEVLITTPESLHLLLASKGYGTKLGSLRAFVADEWHELLGSKRAVQVELALSRIKSFCGDVRIWGISATIGNLDEALHVLLGRDRLGESQRVIRADIQKEIEVLSILPDEVEKFPWAGHLGIKLLDKVLPIINESESTLLFTNTRAQAEIWYYQLLQRAPELSGLIAMHHGSIDKQMRIWVEQALHEGKLKAVVCTSSLDLGVDFRPVETIIQIGGPKGIARFVQRAGRSGHQPGKPSRIWFLPTHSLELIEAAAMRQAIKEGEMESRPPYVRSFDVLVQYLVTLAVSDGFDPRITWEEVKGTFSYESITEEEWYWVIQFITHGGESLQAYNEYHKVVWEDGLYKVTSKKIAMRHRLSIGTIVSDQMITVKWMSGGRLGTIEEWFISRMKAGDVFWFAGRSLEFVRLNGNTVFVRKSKAKKGKIPSWQGGRLQLSSKLSHMLRRKLNEALEESPAVIELATIRPLMEVQQARSIVPREDQLLIEKVQTREGCHVFVFPFEGRNVHEGLAFLLAHRLSMFRPFSFSIAFNDYGFELLSDQDIPIAEGIDTDIFSTNQLWEDIQDSVNTHEMGRRRFRDIASIAGLVFQGFPGKPISNKHLQSNSQLFYDVFLEYEPDNLLLQQAEQEVMEFQLEESRMREAMERIQQQEIVLMHPEKPSPFSFPILVDRLRERFTTESLEERVRKMTLKFD